MLDVSKIESGRLQIQRNAVRTNEFFAGLVDMFRLQGHRQGPRLPGRRARRLAERGPDRRSKRLRQILINLLSNAIKFTARGHVGLRVAYRSQIATLSIDDTGSGIATADRERIFEPFDRGPQAVADAVPGLGLGLTITKLLTELMGGEIAVASPGPDGVGSSFPGAPHVGGGRRPRACRGAARSQRLPRAPADAARGRRRCRAAGLDARHSRAAGLLDAERPGWIHLPGAVVEDVAPDLFILDISMPGMSGWDLARMLRGRGFDTPILMMSANLGELSPAVTASDGREPRRSGDAAPQPDDAPPHDAVLPKPFDLARLLDLIEALLAVTWIEGGGSVAGHSAMPHIAADPAPGAVAELLRLGAIGYVRGIEAKLAELAAEPNQAALAATLRHHIERFDFEAYTAVLEAVALRAAPHAADEPLAMVLPADPDP